MYDFEISYCPGKENLEQTCSLTCLSRLRLSAGILHDGQSPAEKFLSRRTCMSFELAEMASDDGAKADMQANACMHTY